MTGANSRVDATSGDVGDLTVTVSFNGGAQTVLSSSTRSVTYDNSSEHNSLPANTPTDRKSVV